MRLKVTDLLDTKDEFIFDYTDRVFYGHYVGDKLMRTDRSGKEIVYAECEKIFTGLVLGVKIRLCDNNGLNCNNVAFHLSDEIEISESRAR